MKTNWIERGDLEDITNVHNMDRPRGLAAIVLLAELALAFWFSSAVMPAVPGSAGSGSVRVVALAPALVWPAGEVVEAASELPDPQNLEDSADENNGRSNGPQALIPGKGDSSNGTIGAVSPDDVRIVSISPSPTLPLWVGDVVNFEVTAEYNLSSANSGLLGMFLQECTCDEPGALPDAISKPVSNTSRFEVRSDTPVEKGRRTQTFAKRIRVPVVRVLAVTVRLTADRSSSGPLDTRQIPVVDAGKPATGSQNTAKILSIRPEPERGVRAGDNVDFEVVVDYNLASEASVLRLTIDVPGSEPLGDFYEPVKKGQRRLVFRERIRMPAAAADSVRVTLRLGDAESNPPVVYRLIGGSK